MSGTYFVLMSILVVICPVNSNLLDNRCSSLVDGFNNLQPDKSPYKTNN